MHQFRRFIFLPFWIALAVAVSVTPASASDPASRLTLQLAFGGKVRAISPSAPAGSPLVCPRPLEKLGMPLFAPPSDSATAVCIGASTEGIEVEFSLPSKQPIDFEIPSKLNCVTLNTSDRNDVMVKVKVALGDGRPAVECDIVRSFLYVLAIERSAAVAPAYFRPDPGAHAWKSTIVVPWSVLRVRGHSSRLNVTVYANGAKAPIAAHAIDLTIEDQSGALSLEYAPVWKSVPPSSTRRPRLHEIGTDAFYDYDQSVIAATTTGNNDAESTVSRALSEVLSGAVIPLPAGRIDTAGPESLVARTETLLAFLKPSYALGDPNLRVFADAEPFRLTRVGSLASGYTLGYLSDIVKTGAFYGLKQGGQFDEAYGLTISTPSVAATPAPLGLESATVARSPCDGRSAPFGRRERHVHRLPIGPRRRLELLP